MTDQEILARVDHTLLRADASWEEIRKVCEEALRYGTASVCIPTAFVRRAREVFPALRICTVVGFPLGNSSKAAKVWETTEAVADGADEIDMVMAVWALKGGEDDIVTDEIRAVKKACRNHILKVIVETCLLTEEEKVRACRCAALGGADYIKTSTGFGSAGAVLADVRLFRTVLGDTCRIKAAGGIHTREEMEAFLEAGADRIGASGAVKVLCGKEKK